MSEKSCLYCKEKEVTHNRNDEYLIPEYVSSAPAVVKMQYGFNEDNYCSTLCANKDMLKMIYQITCASPRSQFINEEDFEKNKRVCERLVNDQNEILNI